jgi:hypothetical protein
LGVLVPLGFFAANPRQRNWILFCVLSAACAWFLSAITINAGQAVHHTVLLWPFLYIALAIGADSIARKFRRLGTPALVLLLSLFSLRGLEQITKTYSNLTAFSPMIFWTTADEPLAAFLRTAGVHRVLTMDWGFDDQILVRSRGLIAISSRGGELFGSLPISDDLVGCEAPDCLLVSHVMERQVYPHINDKLDVVLERNGLQKHLLRRISDSHGMPTFEVFGLRQD